MSEGKINILNTKDILEGELSTALEDSSNLDEDDLLKSRDILRKIKSNLEQLIYHLKHEIRDITVIYPENEID